MGIWACPDTPKKRLALVEIEARIRMIKEDLSPIYGDSELSDIPDDALDMMCAARNAKWKAPAKKKAKKRKKKDTA